MGKRSFYYVVGRQSCPYCVKAKDLLVQEGKEHQFRDLENQRGLLREYTAKYKWNTVPMVFYFDSGGSPQFLGGYNDLVDHLNDRK